MTSPSPDTVQRQAAGPRRSVWVAASAGAGKTKVLTDRLLALLLDGTAPQRILALTFTRAAAAEMATRVAERLRRWAVLPAEDLRAELTRLPCPRMEEDELFQRARSLFARLLETPGGLKIQTIHGFCESLLKRFPLEAGVAPHFDVMDERDAREMLAEARESVLRDARQDRDSDLAVALETLTRRVHETTFSELMEALADSRGEFRALQARYGDADGIAGAVGETLGVSPDLTEARVLAGACAESALDRPALKAAAEALPAGKKTDRARGEKMAGWLEGDEKTRRETFKVYESAFLTKEGEVRKSLATKDVAASHPAEVETLYVEAERLHMMRERRRSALVMQSTAALVRLGTALLSAYEARKQQRAFLDYDDLVLMGRRLLESSGAAAWVLYKLDGGLDHILVDEAQDTNPDQWEIVRRLSAEFFAGETRRENTRTVFAVGDRKQSIYGFQGARPEAFDAMRRRYRDWLPEMGRDWAELSLNVSFRSTPAVLSAVENVFSQEAARPGVLSEGESATHVPFRQGTGGIVEMWPVLQPKSTDAPPPWKPPVERVRGDSPSHRLAALLARRIREMIGRERLAARGRTVRPADILILLRRRGPFMGDMVNALKRCGVPVAGVDRMVLTEQMAVMDLMALGDFLLLPEDDLTLATVLKGPLFAFSESRLFRLAHGRGQKSLWQCLKQMAEEEADVAAVVKQLTALLNRADVMRPHDLYAWLLGAMGGRRLFLKRLGPQAEDPLDEFMTLARQYEQGHTASLQGFLHWLRAGEVEIKRDLEQAGAAVRVMTVHGAKGLQAPVVFLPDTRQKPRAPRGILWTGEKDGGVPLWAPSTADYDPVCRQVREAMAEAEADEYRRLLYVAMTRAEDRLYVCGWDTQRSAPEGTWYDLVRGGLEAAGAEPKTDDFLEAAGEIADSAEVLRLDLPCSVSPAGEKEEGSNAPSPDVPEWLFSFAPEEPAPPRPLAPSHPGTAPPEVSPLAALESGKFRRGTLVHGLLERLPDVSPPDRLKAGKDWLARQGANMTEKERDGILKEVLAVLEDPAFSELFGPESRAEVSLAGCVGARALAGRVDRLVVTPEAVRVVDFKAHRHPPDTPTETPSVYLGQLAAYAAVLETIFPDREIRCALLWTSGPRLMEVPADLLAAHTPGAPEKPLQTAGDTLHSL